MGTCASTSAAPAASHDHSSEKAHAPPTNQQILCPTEIIQPAPNEYPNAPAAECSLATSEASAPTEGGSVAPPISPLCISSATHWCCDQGVMWPKIVDFGSQCPKGHSLSVCCTLPLCHVCAGDADVCMTCKEGCLYGVCSSCLPALRETNTTIALSNDARVDVNELDSLLGVSPAFLKSFKSKWSHVTRGWTTGQVCHLLVKSLTCRSRGSICEDMQRAGSADVGLATLYLSHCWKNVFDDTVEAALEAAEESGVNQVP
jgi:hypothetical protein